VLITLVTVFWRKIKASWHYVTGLLVQRMVIRLDARYSMMSYLARYGKVSRFRDIFVSAYSEVVKRGHYELTSFEPICLNGTNLIWLGNVPVMITIGGSDKGNISDNGNMPGVIHLSFLRGTIDPDKLVKKATEEYNLTSQNNWVLKANSRKRFFVKRIPEAAAGTSQSKGSTPDRNETSIQWYQFSFNRLISHNVDDLGNPVNCNGKALENLFFPAHIEKMQQEIVLWRSKREWYFQRGLPWKRGWLPSRVTRVSPPKHPCVRPGRRYFFDSKRTLRPSQNLLTSSVSTLKGTLLQLKRRLLTSTNWQRCSLLH
jgi:hypothetical protein